MNEKLLRVIVVIVAVAVTEFVKKVICKDDKKYNLIYTLAPVVLCAIAFAVIALIQKADVWASLMTGATLGLTCMGSYDALAVIIHKWKDKSPSEIAKEVGEIINKKEISSK